MARKVSSITLSKTEKDVYEISYVDYRWFHPGYTGNRKHKRFRSVDAANKFLKELYTNISDMAVVTNYTYKPKKESSIERTNNSGLIHINTVNEYANFMFFSTEDCVNQPCPSTAFVSEQVVNSVLSYTANQKRTQFKQMLQNSILTLSKTA